MALPCSTPEGIGGGIRADAAESVKTPTSCAQRPKASEGESASGTSQRTRSSRVLNARRHRRGNQLRNSLILVKFLNQVLNARRHRRGNQTPQGIGEILRRRRSSTSSTLVRACIHVKRGSQAAQCLVEESLTWISFAVIEQFFRRCPPFVTQQLSLRAMVLDPFPQGLLTRSG